MKLNRSVLIALSAFALIILWFIVRSVSGSESESDSNVGVVRTAPEIPSVVAMWSEAKLHQTQITLYGRTEANREVSVKAETAGLVVSTPLTEGQRVAKNTVICRQDVDARQAMVDQAAAQLKTRELEYKAAKSLVDKGYRSETQLATAEAQRDGAKAALAQAQIERNNIYMRAPFSGIFERQLAEVGDFLAPGQPCGLLVELDPILVIIQLTEKQVGLIKPGQQATMNLATGETVDGTVRLVESKSNPSTRTFRAEIAVPNPGFTLKAGVTATARLDAGAKPAHRVPAHILSLNDDGTVGVRHLDSDDIVRFAATETVDEDNSGAWVTGLPERTRIILKGQDFVSVGTKVEPTMSASAASTAAQ